MCLLMYVGIFTCKAPRALFWVCALHKYSLLLLLLLLYQCQREKFTYYIYLAFDSSLQSGELILTHLLPLTLVCSQDCNLSSPFDSSLQSGLILTHLLPLTLVCNQEV